MCNQLHHRATCGSEPWVAIECLDGVQYNDTLIHSGFRDPRFAPTLWALWRGRMTFVRPNLALHSFRHAIVQ